MRLSSPLLLILALLACTPQDGDSAARGIHTRTAESTEAFALGVATGNPSQEFSRIVGVWPVADSALLVASAGTHDLRLFDLRGRLLATFGRQGSGPGEYEGLHRVFMAGDTARVFDFQHGRVDGWSLSNGLLESTAVPAIGGSRAWMLFGVFTDGSRLISASPRGGGTVAGTTRTQLDLARWTPGESAPVPVDSVPWAQIFTVLSPNGSTGYAVPLSGSPSIAVVGDAWWYTDGSSPMLQRRAMDGRLLASLALPFQPEPVTEQDRREYADRFTRNLTGPYLERARLMLDDVEYPERLPAVTELVVGADGSLWAGRYVPTGASEREWYVVGTDGELAERVLLPASLRLFSADADRVYGVVRDEVGTERVVAYELVAGSDDAIAGDGRPRLHLIGSVALQEGDTAFVGQPVELAIAPDGSFLVSDSHSGRILIFERDGAFVRTVGRQGNGPNEFSRAPSRLTFGGDSLLYAVDGMQVKLFAREDWAHRQSYTLPVPAGVLAFSGDRLFVGQTDPGAMTSFAFTDDGGATFHTGGFLPPILGGSSGYVRALGEMSVLAARDDRVATAHMVSDQVYVTDLASGAVDSIRVPAVARWGVDPALFAALEEGFTPERARAASAVSMPVNLHWLSSGLLALVTGDVTMTTEYFRVAQYLSLVDVEHRRSCVDAPLPGPEAPPMRAGFRGDTMFVLEQPVDSAAIAAPAMVRMYRIEAEGCEWLE